MNGEPSRAKRKYTKRTKPASGNTSNGDIHTSTVGRDPQAIDNPQYPTDRSAGTSNGGRVRGSGSGNVGSGDNASTPTEEKEQNPEISAEKETLDFSTLFGGEPPKKRGRRKKSVSSTDSKAVASLIIDTVDLFATAKLGPNAAFQPTERLLIQPSLEHIITRYGSAAEKLSAWLDPLLLVGGLALYVTRISQLIPKEAPQYSPVTPDFSNNNAHEFAVKPPEYGKPTDDIYDIFKRD